MPLLNLLTQALGKKLYALPTNMLEVDGLIPVPMHTTKLQARGFNQCHWIAKRLCHTLQMPLLPDLCLRSQAGTPQALKTGHERRTDTQDVFQLRYALPEKMKHLVILDDVITTGATVESIATLLKTAGAAKVSVWTLASAFG